MSDRLMTMTRSARPPRSERPAHRGFAMDQRSGRLLDTSGEFVPGAPCNPLHRSGHEVAIRVVSQVPAMAFTTKRPRGFHIANLRQWRGHIGGQRSVRIQNGKRLVFRPGGGTGTNQHPNLPQPNNIGFNALRRKVVCGLADIGPSMRPRRHQSFILLRFLSLRKKHVNNRQQ